MKLSVRIRLTAAIKQTASALPAHKIVLTSVIVPLHSRITIADG
jgi:hypothetical protein